MKVSRSDWVRYIRLMSRMSAQAGEKMARYMAEHPDAEREDMIAYAYALATQYGEGTAALACEMYDALAEAQGAQLPPSVPAATATYGETGKAINGTLKNRHSTVPDTVGRLVKQAGADTMLQNAKRDGAEFAWVPRGDTCAFCIMLASNGWQHQSRNAMKNGHAEHIHANCDCNYVVRFDGKSSVEGYDPDEYLAMYENADGATWQEKLNSMRREQYAENAPTIRAQKRAAYAARAAKGRSFGNSTAGYTPEQQKEIQALLDGAPQDVRDLWDKYGSQLQDPDSNIDRSIGSAYFDPADGRVHMDPGVAASGREYSAPYQTHFHEYAHNIDYLAGQGNGFFSVQYRDSAGQSLEDVIMSDWDKAMKDIFRGTAGDRSGAYQKAFDMQLQTGGMGGEGLLRSLLMNWRQMNGYGRSSPEYLTLRGELDHAVSSVENMRAFYVKHFDKFGDLQYDDSRMVAWFCSDITSNETKRDRGDLSDMFGRYALQHGGGSRPFGFGHDPAYIQGSGKLATEAFAEMVDATVTNPGALGLIQTYLPNAYDMFLEMLKGMI